ncbi:(d)CMP kinase [Bounagaea algeriensis]
MTQLRGVVALDGPSGTGKSTVARRLALELRAKYLDTGAMYRAATLAVLRAGVDPADAVEVERVVRSASLAVRTEPDDPAVLLGEVGVEAEIRGAEVTGAVSAVSAIPAVREVLVAQQREEVREALAAPGGVVVEGRDIGTAVVPDARLKVFLTASSDARAQRRTAQDTAAGRSSDVPGTAEQVHRRDQLDAGRSVSPMRQACDAVELDTTELGVTEVLSRLHGFAEERGLLGDCAPSASERTAG